VENLLKKVEKSTVKQVTRPTSGGTANGNRPARYYYWRTGFGVPLPYPLEFWVQQAGEYHCRPHGVTGSYEYLAGSVHCFLQTEGAALLEIGSKAVLIRAGDLFMLPANSQFSYRAQASIKYHWFVLAGQWPAYISDKHRWLSVGQDADLLDKFIELREILILKPAGFALTAVSIVFAVMARLSAIDRETPHPESEYPETVRNALIFLRENYADSFDSAQTADAVGVSQSHLRALFEKWVGESPQQYHTGYRMMQARRLLGEQTMTVSEVAYQIGFTDTRYFSRVFKQLTGLTPSQYAHQYANPMKN
jgi:AraC-like DNA-binding protein